MRLFCAVLGALLAVAGAPSDAQACSCYGGPPTSWAGRADAVFLGRPIGVGPSASDPVGEIVTTFAVDSVWKGHVRRRVLVATDLSSCGGYFPPGEQYLVFASSGRWGRLRTAECTGTAPASRSAAALAVLGVGASPRPRSWWPLLGAMVGTTMILSLAAGYARHRQRRRDSTPRRNLPR
jgi:hypothetical protein